VPRPLGQHFLTDPGILDRIVDALAPTPDDVVLEVGPGQGTLTRRLAPRVARVVAIEKDRRLVAELRDARPSLGENVVVLEADALEVEWGGLVGGVGGGAGETAETTAEQTAGETTGPDGSPARRPVRPSARPFKVLGNIPYYITSPLIEKALQPPWPSVVVYLVQKEVADRVVATPGGKTYGALSVGVQAVAHAERLFVVRAGAFRPPPAVNSAVLRLTPRREPLIADGEREEFRRFVVGLFGRRRKQITGGLRAVGGLSREEAVRLCSGIGIDPAARPETLEVPEFLALFRAVPR